MPDVTAYVDDRQTSEFYPTPEKLVQRMLCKIKWDPVEAILEPSAGKGDILRGLATAPIRKTQLNRLSIECIIGRQPTIEAEPVRHGRWIDAHFVSGGDFFRCSECGCYIEKTYFANDYNVHYCPYCGAKMDATDTNVGGKGDEEMDLSPLDFLAAEYDRKHPQGIRFVDCMEGADDGACKKV